MANLDEMKAAYENAARSGDFQQMGEQLIQYASDDFGDEYPQSGERLNLAALQKMAEGYSSATGKRPVFTYKRMLGGEDTIVVEGSIDYGDGVPVRYVGIGEVRDAINQFPRLLTQAGPLPQSSQPRAAVEQQPFREHPSTGGIVPMSLAGRNGT